MNDENIAKEASIDDTLLVEDEASLPKDNDAVTLDRDTSDKVNTEPNEDTACDSKEDESTDSLVADEEIVESEELPVFEREDWGDKVSKFEKRYPLSDMFLSEIGEKILNNDSLWNDEYCLERALLDVLSEHYSTDEDRASDEEFLENYIYNNEAIRAKIVDEYMEELDRLRLPSTMNRGGKISLSRPMRPSSIREAGALAEKMMKR